MTKMCFRAHPMMILRIMRPYGFVLLFPMVRAVIQYIMTGTTDIIFAFELIIFAIVLNLAVLGWRSVNITVKGRQITIKKGFLIKSCAVLEFSRISSISLKQNVFDYLFGSVGCAINTEAGAPQKSDFEIKMYIRDAKRLSELVYGDKDKQILKFSTFRIALLAASTSSAATGIIVAVPVISKIGDLLGVAISDMLLNEINSVSERFNSVFPPVVNTFTIILIIAYGVSFVVSLLKNMFFRLKNNKNTIEVRSGLIIRKRITFRKTKINNICFEQTFAMRLLKKYCLRASVGGFGDHRGDKAIIIPVAGRKELETQVKTLFPYLYTDGVAITPSQTIYNLYLFLHIPALLMLFAFGAGAALVITFPYFDRVILFLMIILMCIDLYYATVCYHNYKFGKLILGDYVIATGVKRVNIRELYCDKSRIGVIKLLQTPSDKRYKTCKVKIIIRSENADSVKIKNLDISSVIKSINQTFKLNISE